MVVAGVLGAGIGSAVVLAQDNLPGRPSIARMFVLNRQRSEAIPVTLQGGDVAAGRLIGTPLVTLAPNAAVAAHASRQSWEYQPVELRAGSDPTAALERGGHGWLGGGRRRVYSRDSDKRDTDEKTQIVGISGYRDIESRNRAIGKSI